MPFRLIAEKYEIWYDLKRYGHLGAFCAGIPVLFKQGPDTVAKISTWIPFQKRDNPKALIRIFLAFLFKFILRRKIIAPEILGLLTQKQHIFSVTFSGTILWKTGGSGACPNHYFGGYKWKKYFYWGIPSLKKEICRMSRFLYLRREEPLPYQNAIFSRMWTNAFLRLIEEQGKQPNLLFAAMHLFPMRTGERSQCLMLWYLSCRRSSWAFSPWAAFFSSWKKNPERSGWRCWFMQS